LKLYKKSLSVNKKIDYTVLYFFSVFIILCFVKANTEDVIKNIYVYHFNLNIIPVIIGICVFFSVVILFRRRPYLDRITVGLFYSALLGIIPIVYAENINHYWGNYLPLLISLISYTICTQSEVDFPEEIYKIICLVCVIISIQVIATELNYFSNLSISNFNNVSVKAFMSIPIGSSNLIAAYLLPMVGFINSFKRNKLTFIVTVLSIYALILCRSKNALSLAILMVCFLIIKKVYMFILKDYSVNRNKKLIILSLISLMFGVALIFVLNLLGKIISDWEFSLYFSPYSNYIMNYLDTISSGRIVVYQIELMRFTDHIFLGNGYGYNLDYLRSHNWIIEILVQKGIIGLAIYIFCLYNIFKNALQYYKDSFSRASINLLLIIYVQGLFEITIFTIGMDFLIWSISGFLIARSSFLRKQTIEY